MDDDEIKRRVDELDAAVRKDDAQFLIYCEDFDQQSVELIGNRSGYLRVGIEMLRAAVASLGPNESITPIDVNYLIRSPRSLHVKRLTRQEDVEEALPPLKKHTWKNKAAGVGCFTVLIFLAVCMFIGIGQVGVWIFGK
jgi:hypothetical protein